MHTSPYNIFAKLPGKILSFFFFSKKKFQKQKNSVQNPEHTRTTHGRSSLTSQLSALTSQLIPLLNSHFSTSS